MDYRRDLYRGQVKKGFLTPSWRFLMHTLIMCLGPRKGGYDYMTRPAQAMMVALILNKPYNFSGFIFQGLG